MLVLANISCIGGMANEMSRPAVIATAGTIVGGYVDAAGIGRRVFILGRSSCLFRRRRSQQKS